MSKRRSCAVKAGLKKRLSHTVSWDLKKRKSLAVSRDLKMARWTAYLAINYGYRSLNGKFTYFCKLQ